MFFVVACTTSAMSISRPISISMSDNAFLLFMPAGQICGQKSLSLFFRRKHLRHLQKNFEQKIILFDYYRGTIFRQIL